MLLAQLHDHRARRVQAVEPECGGDGAGESLARAGAKEQRHQDHGRGRPDAVHQESPAVAQQQRQAGRRDDQREQGAGAGDVVRHQDRRQHRGDDAEDGQRLRCDADRGDHRQPGDQGGTRQPEPGGRPGGRQTRPPRGSRRGRRCRRRQRPGSRQPATSCGRARRRRRAGPADTSTPAPTRMPGVIQPRLDATTNSSTTPSAVATPPAQASVRAVNACAASFGQSIGLALRARRHVPAGAAGRRRRARRRNGGPWRGRRGSCAGADGLAG